MAFLHGALAARPRALIRSLSWGELWGCGWSGHLGGALGSFSSRTLGGAARGGLRIGFSNFALAAAVTAMSAKLLGVAKMVQRPGLHAELAVVDSLFHISAMLDAIENQRGDGEGSGGGGWSGSRGNGGCGGGGGGGWRSSGDGG